MSRFARTPQRIRLSGQKMTTRSHAEYIVNSVEETDDRLLINIVQIHFFATGLSSDIRSRFTVPLAECFECSPWDRVAEIDIHHC